MDTNTIESPLTINQLLSALRDSWKNFKKKSKLYGRMVGTEKIPKLGEVLKSLVVLKSAPQKLTFKFIDDARNISLRLFYYAKKNPAQANPLMPMFNQILETLRAARGDEVIEVEKSKAMIRKIDITSGDVRKAMLKTQEIANSAAKYQMTPGQIRNPPKKKDKKY